MSESHFCFVAILGDVKDDFCPLPLGLIFCKFRTTLDNKPYDSFAGYEFGHFLFGAVEVIIAISKHVTYLARLSLNLSFPSSANVVNSFEGFLRCLVYRKRSGIIFLFTRHSLSHRLF
jgi:hypothetical protein